MLPATCLPVGGRQWLSVTIIPLKLKFVKVFAPVEYQKTPLSRCILSARLSVSRVSGISNKKCDSIFYLKSVFIEVIKKDPIGS